MLLSEENKPTTEDINVFFAKMDIYVSMAHFVGKELHIRPTDILNNWCCPELIVAYGEYANEKSYRNYKEWEALDTKNKGKRPKEYQVKFV